MKVIRIERADLPKWQAELSALEKLASYPIGNDRFQIDHGADYFKFFERIGTLYYYATLEDGKIVAVGAGMLRNAPMRAGDKPKRFWYGGDLKVHPEYRGKRFPLTMATRVFLPNFLRCRRGYAISMNPGDGSENRVVTNLTRFKWAPVHAGLTLELYSLDADAMREAAPVVTEQRGPLSYLSLRGIKDIVLESTGAPMPLLHVQFGPFAAAGVPSPVQGHTHMLCALRDDELSKALGRLGHQPSATATILHSGMSSSDFRFVLSSDI